MYLGRVVEAAPTEELFAGAEPSLYAGAAGRGPRSSTSESARFHPVKGEIPSPLEPPTGCHFHPRCPHAMQRCRSEAPMLREVAPGRLSACHLNEAA